MALRPLVLATLALVLLPLTASAEEPARVFLLFAGSEDEATVLESVSPHFQSVVLQNSSVTFAGTQEMEAVYADCRQQVGVDASAERECQLKAARRVFVEQVLEIRAEKLDSGYEFTLQVWAPDNNELVYSTVVGKEGSSLKSTAKEAYAELAKSYLCQVRKIDAMCSGGVVSASAAKAELKITGITPLSAVVLLDDVEIGVAPGSFAIEKTGAAKVTLRAEGYEDLVREVELGSAPVLLSGLSLVALQAKLAVYTNVDGVSVTINGQPWGTLDINAPLEYTVPAGRCDLLVEREGYLPHRESVTLGGGERLVVKAQLVPTTPTSTLPTSPIRYVFDATRDGIEFLVEFRAADGTVYPCPQPVTVGRTCLLTNLPAGEGRLRASALGYLTFSESLEVDTDDETLNFEIGTRLHEWAVVTFALGGMGMAAGATFIGLGAGLDNSDFLTAGIPTLAVGVLVVGAGFLFDEKVDVDYPFWGLAF